MSQRLLSVIWNDSDTEDMKDLELIFSNAENPLIDSNASLLLIVKSPVCVFMDENPLMVFREGLLLINILPLILFADEKPFKSLSTALSEICNALSTNEPIVCRL